MTTTAPAPAGPQGLTGANITAPGFWLINIAPGTPGAPTGFSGIVRYKQAAGTLPNVASAAYLGQKSISLANLQSAAGQLGVDLTGYSGGLQGLISDAEKSGVAGLSTAAGNYWLVRSGPGQGTVVNAAPGTQPAGAGTGAAVYLGPTVADINKYLTTAAGGMGLHPGISAIRNPFAVTGLGDLFATLAIILGGQALIEGAGAAAGGAGTSVEAGAGAATAGSGAAAGAGAGGAAGTVGKVLSSAGGKLAAGLSAASIAALFTSQSFWVGLGMILAGTILILLGILGLSGVSGSQVASRVKAAA